MRGWFSSVGRGASDGRGVYEVRPPRNSDRMGRADAPQRAMRICVVLRKDKRSESVDNVARLKLTHARRYAYKHSKLQRAHSVQLPAHPHPVPYLCSDPVFAVAFVLR